VDLNKSFTTNTACTPKILRSTNQHFITQLCTTKYDNGK
jgi:hypothetical protein